jgi:hypothetical protein
METKCCSRCQQELPFTAYNKSSASKLGLHSTCRECLNASRRKNPVPEKLPQGMKRCYSCKNIFPSTTEYFSVDNRSPSGFQSMCKVCYKEYRETHHEQILTQKKDYYEANKDEINAERRAKYQENPEAIKEKNVISYHKHRNRRIVSMRIAYYANNAHHTEYRAKRREIQRQHNLAYYWQNRESELERTRIYVQTHPIIKIIAASRRRARERALAHFFTAQDWDDCRTYWNFKCCICFSDQNIEAEHWISLFKVDCPGTVPKNMLPMCKSCNSSKKDKDSVYWLVKKFGEEAAMQKLAEIEAFFKHMETTRSEGINNV